MTVNKDEIRRTLDAATPGRWVRNSQQTHKDHFIARVISSRDATEIASLGLWSVHGKEDSIVKANWKLITNAPTLLRALLAELDAKDAEIERLREQLASDGTWKAISEAAQRALQAAELERDRLEKRMKSYELRALRNAVTCDELRQQNAELRDVLEWYASRWNHEVELENEGITSIQKDKGQRARTILDRYKDAQPPEELIGCPVCGQHPDDLPSCDYCKGGGIVPRSKGYEEDTQEGEDNAQN